MRILCPKIVIIKAKLYHIPKCNDHNKSASLQERRAWSSVLLGYRNRRHHRRPKIPRLCSTESTANTSCGLGGPIATSSAASTVMGGEGNGKQYHTVCYRTLPSTARSRPSWFNADIHCTLTLFFFYPMKPTA